MRHVLWWRRICSKGRLALVLGSLLLAAGEAQGGYEELKSFGIAEFSVSDPNSPLIEASDGKLYGTSYFGGIKNRGTVFRINRDGTGLQVLHHFAGGPADASGPRAGLIEGRDGALYGTAISDATPGTIQGGIVFKLNKDGTGYQIVHRFRDGSAPWGRLLEGRDAAFYGTTTYGGNNNVGVIFRMEKNGSNYAVLHHFGDTDGDGRFPVAGLIEGDGGSLYGFAGGGVHGHGVVFAFEKTGGFRVLWQLTEAEGSLPLSLLAGADGSLYGTTRSGGNFNRGTVFRLAPDGTSLVVLHHFASNSFSASNQRAGLVEGSDGALYGTTAYGGDENLGMAFKLERDGEFAVLHSFSSDDRSGRRPLPQLVEGTDGALYGMTWQGAGAGAGTVFRLSRDGESFETLRRLSSQGGDGSNPHTPLIEGRDGKLYGATERGGHWGLGVVFQLDRDGGGYSVLHEFDYRGTLHWPPTVMEASDSALYGTISGGVHERGAVFRLDKNGDYQLLYSFSGNNVDGTYPGRLIETRNGMLLGATSSGTIFQVGKNGDDFGILHRLPLGGSSQAALLEGSDYALYGVTSQGGTANAGTVFRLNRDGSGYQVLHNFGRTSGDGRLPMSELIEGPDGSLYGTALSGGSHGGGAVFKLSKDGSGYTVLYSFPGGTGGFSPRAGMVIGSNGAMYGTASAPLPGGSSSSRGGIIYRINMDGTGYRLLRRDVAFSPLLAGSDGLLYGATLGGGYMGQGSIFRLLVEPLRLSLELTNAGAALMVFGIPGRTYWIQATHDLNAPSWRFIGSAVADADGWLHFMDAHAPMLPVRYYRAVER